jgi:hypothetical protein
VVCIPKSFRAITFKRKSASGIADSIIEDWWGWMLAQNKVFGLCGPISIALA